MFVENLTTFQSKALEVQVQFGILVYTGPGTFVMNRLFSYYQVPITYLTGSYMSAIRPECLYYHETPRRNIVTNSYITMRENPTGLDYVNLVM